MRRNSTPPRLNSAGSLVAHLPNLKGARGIRKLGRISAIRANWGCRALSCLVSFARASETRGGATYIAALGLSWILSRVVYRRELVANR